MPFNGDTLGAFMLPRVVLEQLQKPNSQPQCGVCADSGFSWLRSKKDIYIWRYREGKDARLRVLTLPRQPAEPCFVAVLADGSPSTPSATVLTSSPAAASSSLMVVVCDADGRLTVWLDAHHLVSPVEHMPLTPSSTPHIPTGTGHRPPLVAAFAAARLNSGPGPSLLVAQSTWDGALHLLKLFPSTMSSKQLVVAQVRPVENRSLAATLGTVLSFVSGQNSRYVRKVPTVKPAAALHLAPMAGGSASHYRLLVLTEDCLDCWAINTGNRPSETLQWSFSNCLARLHDTGRGSFRSPLASLMNLDMAVGVGEQGAAQRVAVWMAEPVFLGASAAAVGSEGRGGPMKQHIVQILEVYPDAQQPAVCSGVDDYLLGYQEVEDGGGPTRRKLLYGGQSQACLLVRWTRSLPDTESPWMCRALHTWSATSNASGSLLDDQDTAAVDIATAADGAARWVVLSTTYGIMEIAAVAASSQLDGGISGGVDAAAGASGGLESSAVITNLLDAVLSQAVTIAPDTRDLQAQFRSLQPLVSGLGRRLRALGALQGLALADYSTQLLDLLPKQWAGAGSAAVVAIATAGGAGGGVPLTVADQLADKQRRHSLLLACLSQAEVLGALSPEVRRVLIENAEKLAAVTALHRLQSSQRDLQGAQWHEAVQVAMPWNSYADAAGDPVSAKAAALTASLVSEAGNESSSPDYQFLSASEIFYARPSISMVRLWETVGRMAVRIREQAVRGSSNAGDRDMASLRVAARELVSLVPVIVQTVHACRQALSTHYSLTSLDTAFQLGKPDWLSGEIPRDALKQLAAAVLAVRPSDSPSFSTDIARALYDAVDTLMSFYASAISAVSQRDPDARSRLMREYQEIRSRYGPVMLQDASWEIEGGGPGCGPSSEPLSSDALIWSLDLLFRDHHCYQLLFDVCEVLRNIDPKMASDRLQAHMQTMPPEEFREPGTPTMKQYVFQRLLEDGRPADLLALNSQFGKDITAFLQCGLPGTSDLLAVHLLKQNAPVDAAAVLVQSVAGATCGPGGGAPKLQRRDHHGDGAAAGVESSVISLGSPKRLLSLARLAARTCGAKEQEATVALQLRLLDLQSRLSLSVRGGTLEPAVLLEEALAKATAPARSETAAKDSAKEAAVVAMEVLALMSSDTRSKHASKWGAVWKAVYEADMWDEIASEGAQIDDPVDNAQRMEALLDTAVCRAARVCARGDILGLGANVVDSAPLSEVSTWLKTWAEKDCRTGSTAGTAVAGSDAASRADRRKNDVMTALEMGLGITEAVAWHQAVDDDAATADMMLDD